MDQQAASRTLVARNRERYDDLVELVEHYARHGDVERVLIAATLAGNLAWNAPVGLLADIDLERTILRTVAGSGRARIELAQETGRVLHVLTEGYETGGHTRLAQRWIERDPRRSDVVLTSQAYAVPAALSRATHASGGRVYDLRAAITSFVDRARTLRRLMTGADFVVLHIHPYDAVALAASCLPGARPPTILENHADHTYWLGVGAADVVANLRAPADRVCTERRGILPDRLVRLPLPIDAQPVTSSRKAVRRDLGLRPGQVAAVTVAAEYKLRPIWGEGFDAVLTRALDRCPDLVVHLVGPTTEDDWRPLQSAFPGRVHLLGVRADVSALYPGMDIYLDAYPISSGTSLLEAGASGLPLLSLHAHEQYGDVYQADAPGLERTAHAATTIEEYLTVLQELVADPSLRRERGETARREVVGSHTGDAWVTSLEELYRRARTASPVDLDEHARAQEDPEYAAALLPLTQSAEAPPDPLALTLPIGPSLDPRTRFDIAVATHPQRTRRLSVRVAPGWADSPAWTMRLTALAKEHPQLSVSLPFVPGDDAHGTRSVAALEPVLAANGDTLDDCGDLTLDLRAPKTSGPALSDVLPLQADALDLLEDVLASPYWAELRSRDAGGNT